MNGFIFYSKGDMLRVSLGKKDRVGDWGGDGNMWVCVVCWEGFEGVYGIYCFKKW